MDLSAPINVHEDWMDTMSPVLWMVVKVVVGGGLLRDVPDILMSTAGLHL